MSPWRLSSRSFPGPICIPLRFVLVPECMSLCALRFGYEIGRPLRRHRLPTRCSAAKPGAGFLEELNARHRPGVLVLLRVSAERLLDHVQGEAIDLVAVELVVVSDAKGPCFDLRDRRAARPRRSRIGGGCLAGSHLGALGRLDR